VSSNRKRIKWAGHFSPFCERERKIEAVSVEVQSGKNILTGKSIFIIAGVVAAVLVLNGPSLAAQNAARAGQSQPESPNVRALAAAVDGHYNHLRTLEAEFTELYRGSGMERTESGTLWLKKPGKMRWEYRSPKEKVFVSDGKTAWFYVPGDRQVRKEAAKKLEDVRSPLGFLLGKTKLEKELRGLSLAPDVTPLDAGNVVMRGVPIGMEERVSEVVIEVADGDRIARIVIEDVDGAATEYRFSEQKEDVAVGDGKFVFVPPAGVEVVEGLEE
jgi:outer membrane lipoprotein carrier protein